MQGVGAFKLALASLFATQFIVLGDSYEVENKRILIDLVQNNPGDPVGWQMTKYADPQVLASLNYTAKMSTGENSPVLAVNFSTLGEFFEDNSVELAWMESYAIGIDAFIDRIHSAGIKAFFFVDMIVLPLKVIDHYKDQILNKDGYIMFNDVTAKVLTAMFTETLQRFPGIDGFVIRTGETYVYDTPYHKGNSPTIGVKSFVDQQQIWIPFIKYLRDLICEKMNITLLFRGWDNFGGWESPAQYYLNVSDPIDPHPLLYFCIKHSSGDFFRFMEFNQQLAIGKHAQIVEVECRRSYEGKGAYPDYIMNGVINGFSEMSPSEKKGLKDIIDTPLIRGLFTWSRGGGWWGPYIHGQEFWVDLDVFVLSQWWINGGKESEESVFSRLCSDKLKLSTEDCGIFRELALLSGDATLYGHYCPEGDYRACWDAFTRDDRIGGLQQIGGHFDWLKSHNLFNVSLAYKRNATLIWRQIQSKFDSIKECITDANTAREMSVSIRYGTLFYDIIYAGWRIMTQGYMHDHQMSSFNLTELHDAIIDYDLCWARYKAFGLASQFSASLYRGVYFNLPGGTPEPGLDATVDKYRNL